MFIRRVVAVAVFLGLVAGGCANRVYPPASRTPCSRQTSNTKDTAYPASTLSTSFYPINSFTSSYPASHSCIPFTVTIVEPISTYPVDRSTSIVTIIEHTTLTISEAGEATTITELTTISQAGEIITVTQPTTVTEPTTVTQPGEITTITQPGEETTITIPTTVTLPGEETTITLPTTVTLPGEETTTTSISVTTTTTTTTNTLPATTVTAQPTCGSNLIKNPSFETTNSWDYLSPSAADVLQPVSVGSSETSTGAAGETYVLRSRSASGSGNLPHNVYQAIALCPGQYTLSFAARRTTSVGTIVVTPYLGIGESSGASLGSSTISNAAWTTYTSAAITIPAGVTYGSVRFQISFTGASTSTKEAQLDNVQLIAA